MMRAMFNQDQRFDELVAGYVIGDLSEQELAELETYDPEAVASAIARTDIAAARALLAFECQSSHMESIPDDLARKLLNRTWSPFVSSGEVRPLENANASATLSPQVELRPYQPKSTMGLREMMGWFAAIAATAVAIASWIPSRNENRSRESSSAGLSQQTANAQQTAKDRDALVASADDLVRVAWTRPGEASATQQTGDWGDVVWSPKLQKGYMRIQGLERNDPAIEQYQLWILDPIRDSKPVDGGVFNIDRDGEIVLPIQAKLQVGQPTLFAITVEKPGGVVVSDQSRLPLLAVVSK